MKELPHHVAIIMDGNGRWATSRGLARTKGHEAGEAALVAAVDEALRLGIKWLTVYAFSTENWSRPAPEVRFLMRFNRELLRRRRAEFISKGVRVRFIGRRNDKRLPKTVLAMAERTEELTKHCSELNLVVALNYGGRAEVIDAARIAAKKVAQGKLRSQDITEATLSAGFYEPDMPEVDLVIRTSGEIRTSNFLIWQAAYAEWIFLDVLWPDFTGKHLKRALDTYRRRVRRFGNLE